MLNMVAVCLSEPARAGLRGVSWRLRQAPGVAAHDDRDVDHFLGRDLLDHVARPQVLGHDLTRFAGSGSVHHQRRPVVRAVRVAHVEPSNPQSRRWKPASPPSRAAASVQELVGSAAALAWSAATRSATETRGTDQPKRPARRSAPEARARFCPSAASRQRARAPGSRRQGTGEVSERPAFARAGPACPPAGIEFVSRSTAARCQCSDPDSSPATRPR